MPRKLTHKEFIEKLKIKNDKIECLGTYIDSRTKIRFKCKKDNYEWETNPSNAERFGCPKCAGNLKKTDKEFKEELLKLNRNIICIGNYYNAKTKIKFKCLIDGYEWKSAPNYILSGNGCPKCSYNSRIIKRRKTHEQFINELKEKHPNIECLDQYKNTHTKIKFRCNIDGYEWETQPSNLIHNSHGCPVCSGTILTNDIFVNRLKKINPYIIPLEKYINSNTKIKFKCLIDGYEWETVPTMLIHRGCGCPVCNSSEGEKAIFNYLSKNKMNFKRQYKIEECKRKQALPFDFAIFKNNKLALLIEYQGEQHYISSKCIFNDEKLKRTQMNDSIKKQFCKDNNIELFIIPYTEFKNIENILDKLIKNF